MHRTKNTLSENARAKSIELLNRHLAAAIDLQAQVKQAHWNVRGPGFIFTEVPRGIDRQLWLVESHAAPP
jgi:DNA-binding ferritin-like protein